MTRWSACRALRARRRRLARRIEGQRAGYGAHLVALKHHERGRYCRTYNEVPANRERLLFRSSEEESALTQTVRRTPGWQHLAPIWREHRDAAGSPFRNLSGLVLVA